MEQSLLITLHLLLCCGTIQESIPCSVTDSSCAIHIYFAITLNLFYHPCKWALSKIVQLEFWSCDQQLPWFVYLLPQFFSVTLSAIANASSTWLSNWKQSWAMENTCSSWCRMIWPRNAFVSKIFWWANCDVSAFALSTCPWIEVFREIRQSLSIVIFCNILSFETTPLADLHWLYAQHFWVVCVVSVEVFSTGGWSTTSVSAMASLWLWKEDQFFLFTSYARFILTGNRTTEKHYEGKIRCKWNSWLIDGMESLNKGILF